MWGEARGEFDWKRRGENRMGGKEISDGGGDGARCERSSAGAERTLILRLKKQLRKEGPWKTDKLG